jgi:hypothetical protein
MKSIYWFGALVLCCVLSTGVRAEESKITVVRVDPVLDTELLGYVLSHQRADVFEQAMVLDSKQGDAFWSLYDQYEKEKEELDGKRLRLLGTYISKHATLSAEEAVTLMEQAGPNQQEDLALRQKYFKLISNQVNSLVAARFAQLDDLIGMATRLAILGNVPLVGDASTATSEPGKLSETPAAGASDR